MSAVDDAVAMLSQAGIANINAVKGNNLPQELVDNLNETAAYGDNDFWALNQEVEVQIWYSQLLDSDPETIEIAMMKAFTHQHWQVAAVRQRTLDQDTQQLFNTFYFSRTKNIGGI